MCKKTNKCMFTAGFGIPMLVYYCATNFAEINVINNNQKGGPLNLIKDIDARILPSLERNEVFLDNLTGDYYMYDHDKNEWRP